MTSLWHLKNPHEKLAQRTKNNFKDAEFLFMQMEGSQRH